MLVDCAGMHLRPSTCSSITVIYFTANGLNCMTNDVAILFSQDKLRMVAGQNRTRAIAKAPVELGTLLVDSGGF